MKRILITLTLALVALGCGSKDDVIVLTGEFDPSYARYEVVTMEFVKGEAVDYRGLTDDRSSLDYFIDQLANLTPEQYGALDQEERKAVWINAYNGIVLRSIIDHYPVESINDIPGVWDSTLWTVAGGQVTLDGIVQILRQ